MSMVGKTIAHYTITREIGRGGMGEVYLATDTRLKRKVALKFLPREMQQDETSGKRFLREAQAAAALDHPYICHIHEIGEADGKDFIAMEYVEGQTLKEKFLEGPMELADVLRIASEMAEGLEKAHSLNIVHRDLKPANVMLTLEGHVKVMDFGLAKRLPNPDQEDTQEVTLTRLTQEGSTLGTVAYMSPEQLKSEEVDTRSDIFSFGIILYEMLAGVHPFLKGQLMETATAILHEDPFPLARYREGISEFLQHMVRKMLAKEQLDRYQSVHEIKTNLVELQQDTAWQGQVTAAGEPGDLARRLPWLAAVALILIGAFLGAAAWNLLWSDSPTLTPVARFTVPLPAGTRFDDLSPPLISPSGEYFVLPGMDSLYLRSLDELEAKPIPGTEDAEFPFFSPDSEWIGFFARGSVRKVLVKGGPPITIGIAPGVTGGGSWSAEGNIIFGAQYHLWRVPADGGTVEQVLGEANYSLLPKALPGHTALLLSLETEEGPHVAVFSSETGQTRILLEGSSAHYLPTGHLVFTRSGSLLAVRFDLATLKVTGTPVPVLENIYAPLWAGLPVAHYSVSDTGTLVFSSGGEARRHLSRLVRVDRTGQATTIISQTSDFAYPRASPNGNHLAVSMQTDDGRSIWMVDPARRSLTRFTFESPQWTSYWSPSGDRLAYQSPRGFLWKPLDGTAEEEPILVDTLRIPDTALNRRFFPGSWSADGGVLVFSTMSPRTRGDIWTVSQMRDEALAFATSEFHEVGAAFSPANDLIAYVSDESGRNEVYIQPYPGPGEKKLVSTDGGEEPVWSRDGSELFYRNGTRLLAVSVGTELGTPAVLFNKPFHRTRSNVVGAANYDVSADGEAFIMLEPDDQATPTEIHVVLNWFEELKRLVPETAGQSATSTPPLEYARRTENQPLPRTKH